MNTQDDDDADIWKFIPAVSHSRKIVVMEHFEPNILFFFYLFFLLILYFFFFFFFFFF